MTMLAEMFPLLVTYISLQQYNEYSFGPGSGSLSHGYEYVQWFH